MPLIWQTSDRILVAFFWKPNHFLCRSPYHPLPLLVSSTTFVNSRVYNFNCGCAHFRFRFIVVFATTSNAVVVVVAVFLAPNVACCYCCCWLSPRIKKRGLRIVRSSFSSTLAAAAAAVRLQFYFTFFAAFQKKKKHKLMEKKYMCVYMTTAYSFTWGKSHLSRPSAVPLFADLPHLGVMT